jgi:hypothetical protein
MAARTLRALMRAMRWEHDARFLKAVDEAYLVHEVVVAIGNYMYAEPGPQGHKTASWRIPAEILAAARQALPDHAGTYAAEDLAYLLVRAQADDDAVHPYLHPWDRLAFTWRKHGLSGAKIARLLRDSGLIDQMPDAGVTELDGWIGAPVTAPGRSYHLSRTCNSSCTTPRSRKRAWPCRACRCSNTMRAGS